MNFLGVYRKTPFLELRGALDAPYVEKGGNALSAEGIVTREGIMACASGRIRNMDQLADSLGLFRPTQGEIILSAYKRWGEEYVRHIEGPVATMVLDREMCILSRDRMGDCPVFYCAGDGFIAFSDHPDCLLDAGACRPVIDENGINELFALGPARTPGKTPYRDMDSLEPGCMLVARDGGADLRRYYTLTAREHTDDLKTTIEKTRSMLFQAVQDILPLHPSVMLSGGLDSSTLTAILALSQADISSYSVDYEGNERHFSATGFQPAQDEPYVRVAAKAIGTKHTRVLINQRRLAETLADAMDARGFPGMGDVDSSLFLFARAIAPRARYIVSGECGDEVFGGYPWFRDAASLRPEAFAWSGSIELRARILKKEIRDKIKPALFVRQTVATAIGKVVHLPGEGGEEACLRTMQNLCFRFFMANLQERAVQICRYCNLHVLTPFSDERLAEYVYNVPWEIKFLGGSEKGLLRAAVEDLLPAELLMRKKSPYPKTYSPDYARIVSKMAMKMLADKKAPILQLIDIDEVSQIARGHLSPLETPWFGQLMTGVQLLAYLCQINAWMRDRRVEVQI